MESPSSPSAWTDTFTPSTAYSELELLPGYVILPETVAVLRAKPSQMARHLIVSVPEARATTA